jgi:hypothetical protein
LCASATRNATSAIEVARYPIETADGDELAAEERDQGDPADVVDVREAFDLLAESLGWAPKYRYRIVSGEAVMEDQRAVAVLTHDRPQMHGRAVD